MLHRRPFYFAEYGSANKIAASNTGTAVWCLDAWFRGGIRGAAVEHHRHEKKRGQVLG